MRVVTWNVNSVRSRLPRLLPWLDGRAPDVVCLQETKLPAGAFDELVRPALTERGYAVAHHGEGRWNGVAIASRVGLDDVVTGLLDEPVNPVGASPDPEARAVSATCAGLRITSVYVPNGRTRRTRTTATSWTGWPRCTPRWLPASLRRRWCAVT